MFRKIVFVICLLGLCGPLYATDYYIDMGLSSGSDDGSSMADAWQNLCDASKGLNANKSNGDVIWIRRGSPDVQAANCDLGDSFLFYVGWPRDAKSINCDWVNGDATVDNVDSNDIDKEQHIGRWITGPDGFDYLITHIVDSNTLEIDRPYQGTTSSNEDVSIKADELPDGVSEPSDTASWSSDADDLALIDFNDAGYRLYVSSKNSPKFYNLHIKDSTYGYGPLYVDSSSYVLFNGCLIEQTTANIVNMRIDASNTLFNRCIWIGSNAGSGNHMNTAGSDGLMRITNSAVNNLGGQVNLVYTATLENVNIGVEVPGDGTNFGYKGMDLTAIDVNESCTNGCIAFSQTRDSRNTRATFVNYGKVLGKLKVVYGSNIYYESALVTDEAAINKKLSDKVVRITLPTAITDVNAQSIEYPEFFKSRKTYDAGTYNIKVWVFNDTGNTLNDTTAKDDIFLKCRSEAAGYGDATDEYVSKWYYSDEIDILDAADADDWDFLQADSVVVDEDGAHIYCEVVANATDAESDNIFIDPVTVNP